MGMSAVQWALVNWPCASDGSYHCHCPIPLSGCMSSLKIIGNSTAKVQIFIVVCGGCMEKERERERKKTTLTFEGFGHILLCTKPVFRPTRSLPYVYGFDSPFQISCHSDGACSLGGAATS